VLSNAAAGLSSTYDFFRLLGDMSDAASNGTTDGTTDAQDLQTFVGTFLKNGNPALGPVDPAYLGAADFDIVSAYDRRSHRFPAVDGEDLQILVGNYLHTVGDVTGLH